MKLVSVFLILCFSTFAFAKEVRLIADVNNGGTDIKGGQLILTYQATKSGLGCGSLIEKKVRLSHGQADKLIETKLKRCAAELKTITLDGYLSVASVFIWSLMSHGKDVESDVKMVFPLSEGGDVPRITCGFENKSPEVVVYRCDNKLAIINNDTISIVLHTR